MAQKSVANIFHKAKVGAAEKAFQQQLKKLKEAEKNQREIEKEECCDHIQEIERMKKVETDLRHDIELIGNKAKVFEIQCDENKKKYEQLKAKHIQLLQVLLMKEKEIQKLTKMLHHDQNDDETKSRADLPMVSFFFFIISLPMPKIVTIILTFTQYQILV